MKIELTENDRKILKQEKRIGYVFMTLIYSFGGLFNLFYFIFQKDSPDYKLISFINFGKFLSNNFNVVLLNSVIDTILFILISRGAYSIVPYKSNDSFLGLYRYGLNPSSVYSLV